VREGTTGLLVKTITLKAGTAVYSLEADIRRARVYAVGNFGGNDYLYEFRDTY
jgi:hypothetical protein